MNKSKGGGFARRKYLVTFHVKAVYVDRNGGRHPLMSHYVERFGNDMDAVYIAAVQEFPGCVSRVYPDTEYYRKRLALYGTMLIEIEGDR